jgi:hypothetical protein
MYEKGDSTNLLPPKIQVQICTTFIYIKKVTAGKSEEDGGGGADTTFVSKFTTFMGDNTLILVL